MPIRTLIFLLVCSVCASCTEEERTLFTHLHPRHSGVEFVNRLTESPDFNVIKYGYFYNGGGVAAGDFNNDGFPDLFFTGNLVDNQLYFNEGKGELSFRRAAAAGIAGGDGWHTGVSLVDINGDGWLDIYVCRSAAQRAALRRNLLFINNGDETFTENAADYGLDDPAYSTQAVFFDYDRDGDVDCFVLNHSVQEFAGFNAAQAAKKRQYDPNYASKLFRNDGGQFVDVSRESGLVANVLSFGLGVATGDFNDDGWLDLYVSNDYNEEDYLYLNEGDGTFRESIRESMTYTSLFSMGSETGDFNNDGRIDLVTLDMLPAGNERIKLTSGDDNYQKFRALGENGFHRQFMRNMLQLNQGGATPRFAEVGQQWGISNTDWSWSVLAGDVDLDRDEDLIITNGYARDYTNMEFLNYTVDVQTRAREGGAAVDEMEVIANMPSIEVHNYGFRNEGGRGFSDRSEAWGLEEPNLSNGAVLADLDLDGDLDLVVSNVNAGADIYRNNTVGRWIAVDLTALPPATAVGSRVTVYVGDTARTREFIPVRGFQSSAYVPLVFGLGQATAADSVIVHWADGSRDVYGAIDSGNRFIPPGRGSRNAKEDNRDEINQSAEDVVAPSPARRFGEGEGRVQKRGIYNDFTIDTLHYGHRDRGKNDFSRQYLLPWMLSDPGPILTTTPDGRLIFATDERGVRLLHRVRDFYADSRQPLLGEHAEIGAARFADVDGDGDEDLITVGYAYDAPPEPPRLYRNRNDFFTPVADAFPADLLLAGRAMATLDADGDGDLDLFLGARLEPGNYPASAPSLLLRNDGGGRFTVAESRDLGMVTAAVVTDYDGDDRDDLVIAREFGTVALIPGGNQMRLSSARDLSPSGVWSALAAADFDGDGRPTLVAGNLGNNNQLAYVADGGLRLYYGRFETSPTQIPILTYVQGGREYPQAARDELFVTLPRLKKNFSDYTSYATATVTDVFGAEALDKIQRRTAEILETIMIEAGGETTSLPPVAQRAPVHAIATPDLDGDGDADLLLGGNRYRNRVRIGDMGGNHLQRWINEGDGRWRYDGDVGVTGEVRALLPLPGTEEILVGRRNGKVLRIQ